MGIGVDEQVGVGVEDRVGVGLSVTVCVGIGVLDGEQASKGVKVGEEWEPKP